MASFERPCSFCFFFPNLRGEIDLLRAIGAEKDDARTGELEGKLSLGIFKMERGFWLAS